MLMHDSMGPVCDLGPISEHVSPQSPPDNVVREVATSGFQVPKKARRDTAHDNADLGSSVKSERLGATGTMQFNGETDLESGASRGDLRTDTKGTPTDRFNLRMQEFKMDRVQSSGLGGTGFDLENQAPLQGNSKELNSGSFSHGIPSWFKKTVGLGIIATGILFCVTMFGHPACSLHKGHRRLMKTEDITAIGNIKTTMVDLIRGLICETAAGSKDSDTYVHFVELLKACPFFGTNSDRIFAAMKNEVSELDSTRLEKLKKKLAANSKTYTVVVEDQIIKPLLRNAFLREAILNAERLNAKGLTVSDPSDMRLILDLVGSNMEYAKSLRTRVYALAKEMKIARMGHQEVYEIELSLMSTDIGGLKKELNGVGNKAGLSTGIAVDGLKMTFTLSGDPAAIRMGITQTDTILKKRVLLFKKIGVSKQDLANALEEIANDAKAEAKLKKEKKKRRKEEKQLAKEQKKRRKEEKRRRQESEEKRQEKKEEEHEALLKVQLADTIQRKATEIQVAGWIQQLIDDYVRTRLVHGGKPLKVRRKGVFKKIEDTLKKAYMKYDPKVWESKLREKELSSGLE